MKPYSRIEKAVFYDENGNKLIVGVDGSLSITPYTVTLGSLKLEEYNFAFDGFIIGISKKNVKSKRYCKNRKGFRRPKTCKK
jgi:hypothetical protein